MQIKNENEQRNYARNWMMAENIKKGRSMKVGRVKAHKKIIWIEFDLSFMHFG